MNELLYVVGILAVSGLGGWFSRICGGGLMKLPRPIPEAMFALIFGVSFWFDWRLAVLSFLIAMGGKCLSHTPYWLLCHESNLVLGRTPLVDPIVSLFFGKMPATSTGSYLRNVFGLFLTGLAVTLVPAMIWQSLTSQALGTMLILLGGSLKPVGYMLGWYLVDNKKTTISANIYGEILTGFFAWLGMAFTLVYL